MKSCIASTVVLFTADSAILKIAALPLKSLHEIERKQSDREETICLENGYGNTQITLPVLFPRVTG